MGKYQDILIGQRGNDNRKRASSLLIGNLRDKDKDGVPTGFSKWADDCEPNNKYKDGWTDTLKQAAQKVAEKAKQVVKKAETVYTKVDTKVGGVLPGGAPSKITPTITSRTTEVAPVQPKPQTKTSSSSSSSGKSSANPLNLPTNPITTIVESTPKSSSSSSSKMTVTDLPTQTGTLPYQTGGTSYYNPQTNTYVTPTNLVSTGTGPTGPQILDVAQKIIEAPVSALVPKNLTPQQASERSYSKGSSATSFQGTNLGSNNLPYQTRGTSTTDYKYKGAEATSIRQSQATELAQTIKYQQVAKDTADQVYNKYKAQLENDIKSGEIKNQNELDKAIIKYSKQAEQETDTEFNKLSSQYNLEATNREKQRIEKLTKDLAKERRFSPENIIRTSAYFVPYYGGTLFASDVYKQVREEGVTKTGISLAKSLPIALVAGVTIGKAKGVYKEKALQKSISEGSFIIKDAGILKETEVGKIKLSAEEKLSLEKYGQKDFTVKKYNLEFEPKKGLEDKSPKVKGTFLEVTDSSGKIIDRFGLGNVEATYKGRTVNKEVISQSIAEKTGDKIKGYSEVVTREPSTSLDLITGKVKTRYTKPRINKYLEDTTITSSIEKDKGKTRLTESETVTSLISKGKYKNEPLMKDYGLVKMEEGNIRLTPDYSSMTGKPVTKTTSLELATRIKQQKQLGKIKQTKEGLTRDYTLVSSFETKGRSLTTFIKKEQPKSKSFWDLGETKPLKEKPIKREPIKFKDKEITTKQEYPTIVGGSGQVSEYAYKEGQVINRAEQSIESGGLLSKQMGLSAVESSTKQLTQPSVIDLFSSSAKAETKSYSPSSQVQSFGLMNIESVSNNTLTGELTKDLIKTNEVVKPKEREKEKTKTEQPQLTFSFLGEEQGSVFKFAQVESQAQQNKQSFKMKQTLKQPTKTRQAFGFGLDYTGEITTPIRTETNKEKPKKKKKFFALSKRYGQIKVVGSSETALGARRKGEQFALSTLGASVGVSTEQGKLINLSPSGMFGQSKTRPNFLVQRRGTRLSSFGERREISLARLGVRL